MRYHDNKNGKQYGPDGHLTDNWDPNAAYADTEYVDVHFRIRSKGFDAMHGHFYTTEDGAAFDEAVSSLFVSLGFSVKSGRHSGSCSTVVRGYESLYLHPQDFSGFVRKSSVKEIAKAMENREGLFWCEWVDLYDDAVEASDEGYAMIIKRNLPSMRRHAVAYARTKRYDRFYERRSIISSVMRRFVPRRVNYLNKIGYVPDGYNSYDPVALEVVAGVLADLVGAGWLIEAREGSYVRAANKGEQKAKHLKDSDLEKDKVSA